MAKKELEKVILDGEFARGIAPILFPLTRGGEQINRIVIDDNGCVYINGNERPKLCIDGIPDEISLDNYVDHAIREMRDRYITRVEKE